MGRGELQLLLDLLCGPGRFVMEHGTQLGAKQTSKQKHMASLRFGMQKLMLFAYIVTMFACVICACVLPCGNAQCGIACDTAYKRTCVSSGLFLEQWRVLHQLGRVEKHPEKSGSTHKHTHRHAGDVNSCS